MIHKCLKLNIFLIKNKNSGNFYEIYFETHWKLIMFY